MVKLKKLWLVIVSVLFIFVLGMNSIKPQAKYNPKIIDDNINVGFRLERGIMVVDFLDNYSKVNSFNLGKYNMYGILNDEGQVSYYLADIFEDENYLTQSVSSKVVKAMIYTEDDIVFDINKPIKFELQYFNTEDSDVFSITRDLDMSDFALLTRFSENITLDSDELSDRLRASMNLKSTFDSNKVVNEVAPSPRTISPMFVDSLYTNIHKTIQIYSNDGYTNDDYYAKSYETVFFNENYKNGIYSDDYITKVVPKHYMFRPGTHSYVGKEYGFTIHTTRQSTDLYVSDVFVYDISVKIPGTNMMDTFKAVAEVSPMYQYRYYAREKGTMTTTEWAKKYDSKLTSVVYKHNNYNAPNYYLKDVQIKFTSANIGKPNPGQADYVASSDKGENFIHTEFMYNGEGKNTGRNDYTIPYLQTQFQSQHYFYTTLPDPYNSGNLVLKHSNDKPLYVTSGYHDVENKTYTVSIPYDTREKQFDRWGMLVKAVVINRRHPSHATNENPLLIGTRAEDNFIRAAAYVENRAGTGGSNVNENELHVSIGADFVRDDTYFLLFLKLGQLSVLDTSEGSYNYGGFYMFPVQGVTNGSEREVFRSGDINHRGGSLYFFYLLNMHSYYQIRATSNYRTKIEVFDGITGELLMTARGDRFDINAKIVDTFKNGSYMFRVSFDEPYQTGHIQFHITPTWRYELPVSTNFIYFETKEKETFVKVYIPKSANYRIGGYGDFETVILVYDINGVLIKQQLQQHPYRIGKNGMLDVYLEGGTYVMVNLRIIYDRERDIDFTPGAYAGIFVDELL